MMDAIFAVAIIFLPTIIYIARTPYKVRPVVILDGNVKMLLILIVSSLLGEVTSKSIGYSAMCIGWISMCIVIWKQTSSEQSDVQKRKHG
jgi:hypothetical protein